MSLNNRELAELLASVARQASTLELAADAILFALAGERVHFATRGPIPGAALVIESALTERDTRQLRLRLAEEELEVPKD